MRNARLWVGLSFTFAAGCLEPGYQVCGDSVCPATALCIANECVPAAQCGDGVIGYQEECEVGVGDQTCESLGFYRGTLSCDACQLNTTGCTGRCGDGAIDADAGEQCDFNADGPVLTPGASCTNYTAFDTGPLGCDATCQVTTDACEFLNLRLIEGSDETVGPRIFDETHVTRFWHHAGWTAASFDNDSPAIFNNNAPVALPDANVALGEKWVFAVGNLGNTELWLISSHRLMALDLATTQWRDATPAAWLVGAFVLDVYATEDTFAVLFAGATSTATQQVLYLQNNAWLVLDSPVGTSASFAPTGRGLAIAGNAISNTDCALFKLVAGAWQPMATPVFVDFGQCRAGVDAANQPFWVSGSRWLTAAIAGTPPRDFINSSLRFIANPRTSYFVGGGQLIPLTERWAHAVSGSAGTLLLGNTTWPPVFGSEAGLFEFSVRGGWGNVIGSGYRSVPRFTVTPEFALVAQQVGRGTPPVPVGVKFGLSTTTTLLGNVLQVMPVGSSSVRLTDTTSSNTLFLTNNLYVAGALRRFWTDLRMPLSVVAVGAGVMTVTTIAPGTQPSLVTIPWNLTELEGNAWDDLYSFDNQTLLHFDGTTWTPVVETQAPIKRLWVSPTNTVWAIGDHHIWRWANGALATTDVPYGKLLAISGTTDDDIFVGAAQAPDRSFTGLLRFDGKFWYQVRLPPGYDRAFEVARIDDTLYVIANPNNDRQNWHWLAMHFLRRLP